MTIEQEITTRLTGWSGLTALIGNRTFPEIAVQNAARPYLTYRLVTDQRESAFGADIGIVSARFQFDAFAEKYADTAAVIAQVRAAFNRWMAPTNPTPIIDTMILTTVDLFEPDTMLYHRAMDVMIHYRET